MKRVLFQGTYFEVPNWANYLAKDSDGEIYAYEKEPCKQDDDEGWGASSGEMKFVSREDVVKIF